MKSLWENPIVEQSVRIIKVYLQPGLTTIKLSRKLRLQSKTTVKSNDLADKTSLAQVRGLY